MELEYIEVAPKVYMTLNELNRIYGLSLEDVHKLQEWICQCEDKYFNAHSVWRQLETIGLDKNLQHNEWFNHWVYDAAEILSQPSRGWFVAVLSRMKYLANKEFMDRKDEIVDDTK